MSSVSAAESELISVAAIAAAIWRARLAIAIGLVIGAAAGLTLAFLMRPVYRAEVVAIPVRNTNAAGLSNALGQLGGLAAAAGVDLHGNDDSAEYLQFLRSRILSEHFISQNNLLPQLYARRWDAAAKTWRAGAKVPKLSEGVQLFNRKVRIVSEDKRTGIVTLSMDWRDRNEAAKWANAYLQLANRELSMRAVAEAQSTLTYLSNELTHATAIGVQQALYRLTEEQMKTVALAKTRADYAFRVVDPATPPESDDFVRPNRVLITLGFALFGAAVGLGLQKLRSRRRSVEPH
jgi:uncharacterized protein involved in exopolysaccharide biosynthesis